LKSKNERNAETTIKPRFLVFKGLEKKLREREKIAAINPYCKKYNK
jgi:hypothetical protein